MSEARNVSRNFGLSAKEFRRLSQLEESIFGAMRDGKIRAIEYLDFMQDFWFICVGSPLSRDVCEVGIDAKTAHMIILWEKEVGRHLCFEPDKNIIQEYCSEFKRFLKKKGIKVDFHKPFLR